MIDIQDHIRNRGALNLFDGQGVKPNTFTERQTIMPEDDGYLVWRMKVGGAVAHSVVFRHATGGDKGSGTLNPNGE